MFLLKKRNNNSIQTQTITESGVIFVNNEKNKNNQNKNENKNNQNKNNQNKNDNKKNDNKFDNKN